MILTKEVNIFINNKVITYYKKLGYTIKPNDFNKIKVEDLLRNSMVRIDVKCDICEKENNIIFQKYTKNIKKYNFYTCVKCSHIKNKITYKNKFGYENYVNIESLKQTVRSKYDKITEDYNKIGYVNCCKCFIDKKLSEFLIKNGRYKHVCRTCRNERSYYNRNKNPHIKAWRSILRGYISRSNKIKSESTQNLLQYSADELRLHISKLLTNDMSWDNYGDWHIDHIVHLTLFRDDTPCYIVNELSNLRPLNSKLNISRHNNLDDDCLKMMVKYQDYIKDEYKNFL
jgi:hypothetical protein